MALNPLCIYIFSGKRKSGKDFVTDRLFAKLNSQHAVIIKLSAPIKSLHAERNQLDLDTLMCSCQYKEIHRKMMIEWSEKLRNEDYGIFCREAIRMSEGDNYPIWIVSDARRKTDIRWFKETYKNKMMKFFRIVCDDSVRRQRGWLFTQGIDDQETECGLDDFDEWDQVVVNNSIADVDPFIDQTIDEIRAALSVIL